MSEKHQTKKIHEVLPWILASLPFVAVVCFVIRYGITIPYWDQWALVPVLGRMYDGSLSFNDLWMQHNAHRILFPKIIMLALAKLTRWNIAFEIAVNVALVTATFAVIAYQLKRTANDFGDKLILWLLPVVSLLVFTLAQWRNLVWGWQMQILLSVFAGVAGLIVLSVRPMTWPRFVLGSMLGIVATYSFTSGTSFWIVALITICATTQPKRTAHWGIFCIALAAIVMTLHLSNYAIPENHSKVSEVFAKPGVFVAYVLKFIGVALFLKGDILPLAAGAFGLISFAVMAHFLYHERMVRPAALLPYISIALYSLGNGMVTAIGRLNRGSAQALSSRYASASAIFWVAWTVVLALFALGLISKLKKTKQKPARISLTIVIAAFAVLVAANSREGLLAGSERSDFYMAAKQELISGDEYKVLRILLRDVDSLKIHRETLRQYKLTVFSTTD